MKKIAILIIVFVLISTGLLSGCTQTEQNTQPEQKTDPKTKLVGVWRDESNGDFITFTENGQVTWGNSTSTEGKTGDYWMNETHFGFLERTGEWEFYDENTFVIHWNVGNTTVYLRGE